MGKAVARTVGAVLVVTVLHVSGLLTQGWDASKAWVQAEMAGPASSMLLTADSTGTPDDPASYSFMRTTDGGEPVRWDVCSPIPVVINPANAPVGGVEDAIAAIASISEASGLNFRYDGLVDYAPAKGWGQSAQAGYPDWAPVLFAWAPSASGLIEPQVAGRAYTVSVGSGSRVSFTSGMVVINSERDAGRLGGFGAPNARGAIYLHELAHIAGLGHVDDVGQMMNPNPIRATEYSAGDLAGFAALKSDTCDPAPAPAW